MGHGKSTGVKAAQMIVQISSSTTVCDTYAKGTQLSLAMKSHEGFPFQMEILKLLGVKNII